jgi:hypothetical protein
MVGSQRMNYTPTPEFDDTMDVVQAILARLNARIDAVKTYNEYRSRLWRAALRLYEGRTGNTFMEASFARSIDQQLTEAWNIGADSVGVSPEDMTPDDMTILEGIINNENNFIARLGDDIIRARDEGMAWRDFEREFGNRVDLWANRYNEVVNTAKMKFGGKQRLKWNLGETEQHCESCLKLNGIIAWADEWDSTDIHPQQPPNSHLVCGGWHCDCTLDPTDERRTPKAIDKLTEIALMGNL